MLRGVLQALNMLNNPFNFFFSVASSSKCAVMCDSFISSWSLGFSISIL